MGSSNGVQSATQITTAGQCADRPSSGSRSCKQRPIDLPAGDAATADLLTSPPLFMALASPAPCGLAGCMDSTSGGNARGQRESALFTSHAIPTFSPGPTSLLPSFDVTPAALRCLFPSADGEKCSTLPSSGLPAGGGLPLPVTTSLSAAAAPVIIKGEQPLAPAGTGWVMVPEAAMSTATMQPQQWDAVATATLHIQQQTPVGESAGGGASSGGAEAPGGIGAVPFVHFQPLLPGRLQLGSDGIFSLGSKIVAQDLPGVLEKIAELESKVRCVEARWGTMHPLTGRAQLLLYHACRHRAAAVPCQDLGAAALKRACAILNAAGSSSEALAQDYKALICSLKEQGGSCRAAVMVEQQ